MPSKGGRQILYCIMASFGFFCLGVSFGWSFPTRNRILKGALGYAVPPDFFYLETLCVFFGGMVSFIPYGFAATNFGTKFTLMWATGPPVLGYILILCANHYAYALTGRVLIGLSGSFVALCQVYVTYTAEVYVRGMIGVLGPLQLSIGMIMAYTFATIFTNERYFTLLCAVPYVMFFLILFCIPETAVFYVGKNKLEKARASLMKVLGETNSERVEKVLKQMIEDKENLWNGNSSLWLQLGKKCNLIALLLSIVLSSLQHFSGIGGIHIEMAKIVSFLTSIDADLQIICYGVNSALCAIVTFFVIEIAGRKLVLAVSGGLCAIACILMGGYFILYDVHGAKLCCAWIPILGLSLYGAGFQFGINCVPLIFVAEVFDDFIRHTAVSICLTINWCCGFLVISSCRPLESHIGVGPIFLIYGIFNCLIVAFSFLLVETKGKTIVEIQKDLEDFKLSRCLVK